MTTKHAKPTTRDIRAFLTATITECDTLRDQLAFAQDQLSPSSMAGCLKLAARLAEDLAFDCRTMTTMAERASE